MYRLPRLATAPFCPSEVRGSVSIRPGAPFWQRVARMAGQIVLEGFLDLKIPCWQRRLATRALALVPAFFSVLWLGDAGVGPLLVGSQVVLSLQLPFAIWLLLSLTSDRAVMGRFANRP